VPGSTDSTGGQKISGASRVPYFHHLWASFLS